LYTLEEIFKKDLLCTRFSGKKCTVQYVATLQSDTGNFVLKTRTNWNGFPEQSHSQTGLFTIDWHPSRTPNLHFVDIILAWKLCVSWQTLRPNLQQHKFKYIGSAAYITHLRVCSYRWKSSLRVKHVYKSLRFIAKICYVWELC